MQNKAIRKEADALRGEIQMKESSVKAWQNDFASELNGGLGQEMLEKLSEAQSDPPKNFWDRVRKNLKKIIS